MRLLNKYNIPESIVKVVEKGLHPPKENRYSIVDLINPPLIRTLKLEKWDDIEQDISEFLWMILGTAVDTILTDVVCKGIQKQHKVEYEVDGSTIVGILDIIDDTTILDWKCTKCSSLHYEQNMWAAQLQLYSLLLGIERGLKGIHIPITKLQDYLILRDWDARLALRHDYPQIPFQVINVEPWTTKQQMDYLLSRLRDHKENPHRQCTPEEKWQTQTMYAVKNPAVTKAYRVLPSKEEAEQWILKNKKKGVIIEERPGENKKCNLYCSVRSVCPCVKGK